MRSVRLKLMLTSFVIVFLPVFFLNRYAIAAFDRFTRKALEEEMISHARMLGEQYRLMKLEQDPDKAAAAFRGLAWVMQTTAEQVPCRFRVISPDAVVLLDSEPGPPAEANVVRPPEVTTALNGLYRGRWELSPDRRYVFYHIALPVIEQDRVLGVVAVTRHTGPIVKAILVMKDNQRRAMALALGFAALISAILAQTMTWRLRRLTRASMEYARGHEPYDVRIRGRDEIGELGRAVQTMAAEIERRHRYNRDFVSTLLHELKTPLTAIKGAAEVLDGTAAEKPEARRKFLSNILFEAERMIRMVGELNELTRLDAEAEPAQRVRCDYPALVREIVERLEPAFDAGHAPIRVMAPERSVLVRAAPGRIEQLIGNLLENAIRYTPPTGSIDVAVEEGPGALVTTRVKDTGCGIPAAHLDRVFDPFFTTVPRTTPRDYGSGLGLAIARTIVENHRGQIRVESEPGQGACFTFTLPAERG